MLNVILVVHGISAAEHFFIHHLCLNGCHKRWYGKTKEHKALLAEGKELPPWKRVTIRCHDFRVDFCTRCREAGVDDKVLQSWMGHADVKMILRVYAKCGKGLDLLKHKEKEASFEVSFSVSPAGFDSIRSMVVQHPWSGRWTPFRANILGTLPPGGGQSTGLTLPSFDHSLTGRGFGSSRFSYQTKNHPQGVAFRLVSPAGFEPTTF